MCDPLEDKNVKRLPPPILHMLQYGPYDPVRYAKYIAHIKPKIVKKMLRDPRFKGLYVRGNVSSDEEAELEIENTMSYISWVRISLIKAQELEEFNHYKFVRHYGNKAVVCHWSIDGEFIQQSQAEFKNSLIDKFCLGEDHKTGAIKRLPLVEAWLKHHQTRRYEYATFLPGKETPYEILNLWRGWPFPVNPNDSEEPPKQCSLFLQHMKDHICGGDGAVYNYLLGWMADAVVNADITSEVAIVLQGAQGSGKTMWAQGFADLFKPHSITLTKPEQLTGKFNKQLQDKCFVFADEAFFAGSKKDATALKTLITDDHIFIEPKGVDGFAAKKYFRLVIASNDEHVIRAEIDDRRYLVLNVDAGENNQNPEYFGPIVDQWKNGGAEALFNWFQGQYWRDKIESGAWNVRMRPKTNALNKQKDLSLPIVQEIVHQMLFDGELPDNFLANEQGVFVATRLLAEANNIKPKDETALGKLLHAISGDNTKSTREYIGDDYDRKQYRGYWLPELSECRKRWEAFLKRDVEWPEYIDSWDVSVVPTPKQKPPF